MLSVVKQIQRISRPSRFFQSPRASSDSFYLGMSDQIVITFGALTVSLHSMQEQRESPSFRTPITPSMSPGLGEISLRSLAKRLYPVPREAVLVA